jgi:DNA-binding GntR family transcriptional regulator
VACWFSRWILACLRNRSFFSLAELNTAIGELLARLRSAKLKQGAALEDTDFKSARGLDRSLIMELADAVGDPTLADAILDRVVHKRIQDQFERQLHAQRKRKIDNQQAYTLT